MASRLLCGVTVCSASESLPVVHNMVFLSIPLKVNNLTKLERHAESEKRSLLLKLPAPQSCRLGSSGFFRADFFFLFDSLLPVWHNIYLARLLLFMSKQINIKKESSTEENDKNRSLSEYT